MLKIKTIVIFLTVFFGALGLANNSLAANHYIRQGASGANNGSDWTNAWQTLPPTLTRGDTYYIADGTYGSYTFDDPVSGTQYISIKKAIISDHGTDTGWDSSYGDGTATFSPSFTIRTSYLVLDGQTRGSDWRSGYGIKIQTPYANRMSKTLNISGVNNLSYITIRYVEIEGSGDDLADGSNDTIYAVYTHSNLTFQYCYVHNSGRALLVGRGVTNSLVEYCYFYHNESTSEQHSQAFSCAYDDDNWIVRYNIFDTIEGTGVLTVGYSGGWKVYGNVFYNYTSASNGIFTGWTTEYMESGEFYNNTIVDSNYARIGMTNDQNIVAKNNLFINNTYVAFSGDNTHDYNAFSGSNAYGELNTQIGLTSSIFVNYAGKNYHLSGATNAGTNIGSEYNTDMDGNTRGSDGIWDRGAYEYVGAAPPDTTPPAAPTGVTVS